MEPVYINAADYANLSLLAVADSFRRKLQRARVVPSNAVPPDVVTMQSRITLRNEETGETSFVSLVYPPEADEASGRVSVLDPLGMELLGAHVGQVLEVVRPTGRQDLRITQIHYQPELSMRTHVVVRD